MQTGRQIQTLFGYTSIVTLLADDAIYKVIVYIKVFTLGTYSEKWLYSELLKPTRSYFLKRIIWIKHLNVT